MERTLFTKEMDLETIQTNAAAKLPLLKQGAVNTEERYQKKNDVKARKNKPDLDSMSFDDLYNNFKIVEQEVKRITSSNTSSSSQNMAFVSSPSSINKVNTVNVQVSTANSLVSTDSTLDKQINEEDLEEMDLKWQLALLSMKARRYYLRTGKKITINGSGTAGYDKSKVECFKCHKMGHFARECRSPRNQESRPRNHDNGNRNQDSSRRTVNVEEVSS
ncbi:ribonuclease H-like domain-containing protein [Tanacetum coccineum]